MASAAEKRNLRQVRETEYWRFAKLGFHLSSIRDEISVDKHSKHPV